MFSNDEEGPPEGYDPVEWLPDALALVTDVETMRAVFAAQQYDRIHAFHLEQRRDAEGRPDVVRDIVERSIRLELAAALRVSEYVAENLLSYAEALVERYPTALASLSVGRMSERHAHILVDLVDTVEPALRDGVVADAVALAESQPTAQFRRSLRKLIDTVRAATLDERHRDAVRTRQVMVVPGEDGMGTLVLHHPIVEVHGIFERVTTIAKTLAEQPGETRTLNQLRADVTADLLLDGSTTSHPNKARGVQATVVVTVPALTLLTDTPELDGDGVRGAGGVRKTFRDPPVLEGVGPIPVDVARRLAGGGKGWMRVLTHPETGMVLSVGRRRYRPPAPLRKLVQWRADRCMAPGCGIPAMRCQIDHSLAYSHGGDTALGNLGPLCVGHHTVKTHGDWTVTQIDGSGGAIEWISPTGRRYVVEPERRVPVFTPEPDTTPPPF